MNIAVTGGSGRLGRAVIDRLWAKGHALRNLDRVAPAAEDGHKAVYVNIDLNDLEAVKPVLAGCDAVIHLAAYTSPDGQPDGVVYTSNTTCSFNILCAAATHAITHVCLASSIHALGNGFQTHPPIYHYLPIDEEHPTYCEDEYSLSKWVMEQQAFAFARSHPQMTIASFRLHALISGQPDIVDTLDEQTSPGARGLWGYILLTEAARACECLLHAEYKGHEVFYITAPRTCSSVPSLALAQHAFPDVPIRGNLADHAGFYNTSKAERLLNWRHISQ